jgi:hypothetical protein
MDVRILATMRYLSAFTETTENQLNRLFDIAAKIWSFADFTKVRVMADFVDGANYRARYLFFPVIIELSYKSRGDGMLILGDDGFSFNPRGHPNYKGELLHDLARHATETAPYSDRGIDSHTTDAWCCVIALGWQYFYPDCLITTDILIQAI